MTPRLSNHDRLMLRALLGSDDARPVRVALWGAEEDVPYLRVLTRGGPGETPVPTALPLWLPEHIVQGRLVIPQGEGRAAGVLPVHSVRAPLLRGSQLTYIQRQTLFSPPFTSVRTLLSDLWTRGVREVVVSPPLALPEVARKVLCEVIPASLHPRVPYLCVRAERSMYKPYKVAYRLDVTDGLGQTLSGGNGQPLCWAGRAAIEGEFTSVLTRDIDQHYIGSGRSHRITTISRLTF